MNLEAVDSFLERLDKRNGERVVVYLENGQRFDEINPSHLSRNDTVLVWNDGVALAYFDAHAISAIKRYRSGF